MMARGLQEDDTGYSPYDGPYIGPMKLELSWPEFCGGPGISCDPGSPGVPISSLGVAEGAIDQGSGLAFKQFNEFDVSKDEPGPDLFKGPTTLQGSVFFQSGFLYNPDFVRFDATLNEIGFPYAGNIQPKEQDLINFFNEDFTLAGQCTATTVEESTILSHSCVYTLCLGGDDCITYYAGGPFAFNALDAAFGEMPETPQTEGLQELGGCSVQWSPPCFYSYITHIHGGFEYDDEYDDGFMMFDNSFEKLTPYEQTVFEGFEFVPNTPSLPPPYPGTIIGGIGKFENIEGSVEVITIAGRRREIGISVFGGGEIIPEEFRGAVVQQIFLNTNQNLDPILSSLR
jgi:hypothetical protein